jgi:hypothetical protein
LALLLVGTLVAGGIGAAAQTPRISKPKRAPPLITTMPALPPAVFDDKLDIGGDDVKARKVETRLSVAVMVNGRGPYQFVVDSGADTSVIGLRIARDQQLPLGTPALLNDMTDRNIVDRVKVASLTLGASTINDLELPALREEDLGGQGMIGIDALARRRLLMDFDKKVIKIEDATKPAKPLPGEIVVTGKRRRGQLILTQVSAQKISLDAVIDTGSEITIGNLALREKLVRRHHRVDTIRATGVTGKTVELQVAQIPELRIGPIVVRNLLIAFADLPPFHVFGIADEPALFLGTDVLETFRRVSLDFNARKVRFQMKRCQSGRFVMDGALVRSRTRASSGSEACDT